MASLDVGKKEIAEYIRQHFNTKSKILDVGAGDGKWKDILNEYEMDAVEIFIPYIDRYKLNDKYKKVFNVNIVGFEYEYYDLIIFGDIIEHLSIPDAQRVIEYAKGKCKDMIIAVPFNYYQGILNGNEYEIHLQPDLDFQTFKKRYKGFESIYYDIDKEYCYYHLKK